MSSFPLPEFITYWIATYPDGQVQYGLGIKAPARIASKVEEVITSEGKEPKISRIAIYTEADIKTDYMVVEGDYKGLATSAAKAADMIPGRALSISRVRSGTNMIRVLL